MRDLLRPMDYTACSESSGCPSLAPFFFRLIAWSAFSGITALAFRLRRWVRLAREEYA